MLDDLRNSAAKSFEEEALPQEETPDQPAITLREQPQREPFLGMTAQQRFALALMLFLMVLVLGMLFLVATDKFYIGF